LTRSVTILRSSSTKIAGAGSLTGSVQGTAWIV
jgi:hypothetical protein